MLIVKASSAPQRHSPNTTDRSYRKAKIYIHGGGKWERILRQQKR